jgi:small-conductance mechanosensitive channel
MFAVPHPVAIYGTGIVLICGFVIHWLGGRIVSRRADSPEEAYRRRKFLTTVVTLLGTVLIIILWARLLQRTGTFLGLLGAGLAVALREPLLSIAGRVAIFAGHMYSVGDRIEINKISGDVLDIGFFYTRMMEIGNWIRADQATGRIVQFSNSIVFSNHVYNYTQNFSYLWDEVQLVITYDSDAKRASQILLEAGECYSREFMNKAEQDLERMQHNFLVPKFELKPAVYMKVTDNWAELTMRYIVDPKKRRAASTFIYRKILEAVQSSENITIASTTMTVTVRPDESSSGESTGEHPKAA